jgi:hypothetical protein
MIYERPHSTRGLTDIVRELQGDESQVRFSARVGIEQSELSRFLRGGRRAGRGMIIGLLRAFPERQLEIIAALMAEGGEANGNGSTPSAAAG